MQRSRIRPSFTSAPARWWRNVVIPTIPVLACFLGGATEKWGEGAIVALLGLILLVSPPKFSLGTNLNLILLAILACAAAAFLPASWFLLPEWRLVLENDFNIRLPATVSPQPWISLGCLVSLLAGLSWLYYVSTLDLELREVRQYLRRFATGIVLLAGLSVAFYLAHIALPFWHNQRGFGPFPNRNQTANLFALTAVVLLACGQDDIRHSRKRWILWLIAFGIVVTGIIQNFSRAGLLLLIAGCVLWLFGFVLRKISAPRMALSLSVLLLLSTVMLIFGGETLDRFHLRGGGVEEISTDLRWRIFQDTFQLIHASPWCGIGLGNFDAVFAIFRNASQNGARVIHPESDWFWFLAESGWPMILFALAGIATLVCRVFPLQEGTNQRFRLAALVAAILFVFHGLIDVSGHRVGTAFSGIFLLGMALHRPADLKSSLWIARVFRVIGILLLVAGGAWVIATRYEMALPGGIGVENEMRKAAAARQGRNFAEVIQRANRALEWAPLKWQLYFGRALAKVEAKRPPIDGLEDFRRARFLEPNAHEVPYQEGVEWLFVEPDLAIAAWQESLRRAGTEKVEMYGNMLAMSSQYNPKVRRGLEEIGLTQHDLALVYLKGATGADFMEAIHRFLSHDPKLQTFSDEEKTRFYSLWAERGDLNELARELERHPDWMSHAWRAMAMYQSRRNDFRAAMEIVRRFGEAPVLPDVKTDVSIDQLRQAFQSRPYDFEVGYQLYREQIRNERTDDALMTVRHFAEMANCPKYFHFLEAEAWIKKGNWERAWKAWGRWQPAGKQ